jgi:hypothetical protein
MTINIADFGRNNLMDVPGSLRRLADQMERNEEPMAEHVIVVCETASSNATATARWVIVSPSLIPTTRPSITCACAENDSASKSATLCT